MMFIRYILHFFLFNPRKSKRDLKKQFIDPSLKISRKSDQSFQCIDELIKTSENAKNKRQSPHQRLFEKVCIILKQMNNSILILVSTKKISVSKRIFAFKKNFLISRLLQVVFKVNSLSRQSPIVQISHDACEMNQRAYNKGTDTYLRQ